MFACAAICRYNPRLQRKKAKFAHCQSRSRSVALCRNRKVVDETMLSQAIYECINFNTRLGYILGSIPFQWDSKRKKLKITNSKLKIFQWYFLILYFILNCIFMTIRAVQAMCCMKVTYVLIFMNLYNVCSWITVCAMQLNSMLYKGEIVNFLNQLMWTEVLFESKSQLRIRTHTT